MQTAASFSLLGKLVLLIACGVRWAAADMCKCSNTTCAQSGGGCCLWDFPVVDLSPSLEGHPHGFALGSFLAGNPSVCVTYPISDEHVESRNYFLISLESVGPEMCIYEPGKINNMKCSNEQVHYCSGESVTGVSTTSFSFYCKNCQQTVDFYFKVYSDQYNTTMDNWCDDVPKPVPSDLLQPTVVSTTTPVVKIGGNDSGSGDSVPLLPTPTASPEPINKSPGGDANGAQSLALPAVFWTLLSALLFIL